MFLKKQKTKMVLFSYVSVFNIKKNRMNATYTDRIYTDNLFWLNLRNIKYIIVLYRLPIYYLPNVDFVIKKKNQFFFINILQVTFEMWQHTVKVQW